MTQSADFIIHARWICPVEPENTLYQHHAIAIKGGRIIDCLPSDAARERYPNCPSQALNQHLLIPGLINAHTHTPMNIYRGLADDLPLMTWLQKHIWPAESATLNEENVALGSQLAIAEMLSGGITCFNDHYMHPNITAKVAEDMHCRAAIGLQMMNVPTSWAVDANEALDRGLEVKESLGDHPLRRWILAPQGPYTIDDNTFKRIAAVSAEQNIRVHIHLHESQAEIDQSIEQFGMRPIERLDKLGLINERLIAVHMVHVTDDELTLLAERGAHIVHCPEANLKLASGIMPMAKYQAHHLNVALGTDGAASNNDLDLLGEMRTAAFIANGHSGDPTCLSAEQALRMATINGARALGLADDIGSIEVGKAADLVAIDLSDWLLQPCYNPLSHLLYVASRQAVSHVWVAGKCRVENGNLLDVDINTLMRRLKTVADTLTPYAYPKR